MDYQDMLKNARKTLKEPTKSKNRFQVPNVRGRIEGNKTLVSNFGKICKKIRRPINHLLKFLNRELATPGRLRSRTAIFKRRVNSTRLNEKIEEYVQKFVICKVCGSPDTNMELTNGQHIITCQACGDKYEVITKL